MVSTSNVEIQLEPVVKPINDSATHHYCERLVASLRGDTESKFQSSSLNGDEICQYLRLSLFLPKMNEDTKGNIRISSRGDVAGSGVSGASIFKRLSDVHGSKEMKINLKLVGFHYAGDRNNTWDITVNHMEIRNLKLSTSDGSGQRFACQSKDVEFPANMRGPWDGRLIFSGDLTVSMTLSDNVASLLYLERFSKSELSKTHKLALEEAVYSDLVIVASNGAEVKCHKSYLAVNSDVFTAMFESQMQEATTNSIIMDDMSERGVRAFLAFIYHWDLTDASKDCGIAYELYCAGHKYDMLDLENAIGELICVKPNEWFTVDMTVRMLLFTKNLEDEKAQDVFKKSLQILKWFNKSSPMNLLNSVEYQQLFQINQKVAMELSTYFLA